MKFLNTVLTNDNQATILLKDKYGYSPYFVEIDIVYDDNGMPLKCEVLEFCPTKMSPDTTSKNLSFDYYIKWGGFPMFVQGEVIPISDDGREYKYLCTVQNGWGDGGNCNIFLLLREGQYGLTVDDVYMEASCH